MKRALVSFLFLCVIAALLALGTWQVERRAWKHALIARVEAGVRAAPVAVPASAGPGDAYRRVTVSGRFLAGRDTFVQASTIRGPGWWVLTPLVTEGGRAILINRGYVPTRQAALTTCAPSNSPPWKSAGRTAPRAVESMPGAWPTRHWAGGGSAHEGTPSPPHTNPPPTPPFQGGENCVVTGLLRLTEPGGGFLRSNDPRADRWYSRDVAAIAAKRAIATAAPYFIDADASLNRSGQPIAGLTVIKFADNHLVYAVTWYILALMTLAGFLYWRRTA